MATLKKTTPKVLIQTKSQQVYTYLREAIVSGEFVPGEKLVLSKIAEMYGLSEIPVREACRRLEAEGLVVIMPYEGVTVTQIDIDDVSETIEIRAILEREAIKLTIPNIKPNTKSELQFLLKQMKTLIANDDIKAFSETNKAYHILLLQDCPNSKLRLLTINTWNTLARARSGFRSMPEHVIEYFNTNKAIYSAIEEGDGERAGNLLYKQAIQYGSKLDKYLRAQQK